MKNRYRLVRRTYGIYYSLDNASGKKESLKTTDKVKAQRLLMARNQSMEQPALNKGMAKVYLSASSPEFGARTWSLVMEKYVASGVESTKDRKERAFRSRPFVGLHKLKLIDTSAEHFFSVLEHKKAGTSTNHYLRRLHNYALHLGWLLSPVMADAAWPVVRGKKFSAITDDEHQRIIAKEGNRERRLYYELLWETGGSQSDIANLNSKRVDRENRVITFGRQKLEGRAAPGISCLRVGVRIQEILDQLPQEGDLFPKIKLEEAKHRAAEFRRRCRTLKIVGRTLHSYRYAWLYRTVTKRAWLDSKWVTALCSIFAPRTEEVTEHHHRFLAELINQHEGPLTAEAMNFYWKKATEMNMARIKTEKEASKFKLKKAT